MTQLCGTLSWKLRMFFTFSLRWDCDPSLSPLTLLAPPPLYYFFIAPFSWRPSPPVPFSPLLSQSHQFTLETVLPDSCVGNIGAWKEIMVKWSVSRLPGTGRHKCTLRVISLLSPPRAEIVKWHRGSIQIWVSVMTKMKASHSHSLLIGQSFFHSPNQTVSLVSVSPTEHRRAAYYRV